MYVSLTILRYLVNLMIRVLPHVFDKQNTLIGKKFKTRNARYKYLNSSRKSI